MSTQNTMIETAGAGQNRADHTPGPWRVGMKPGPMIYGPKGEQVASMHVAMLEQDEHQANARLIAAAPELLAACEAAIARLSDALSGRDPSSDMMEVKQNELRAIWGDAVRAVDKAKGKRLA